MSSLNSSSGTGRACARPPLHPFMIQQVVASSRNPLPAPCCGNAKVVPHVCQGFRQTNHVITHNICMILHTTWQVWHLEQVNDPFSDFFMDAHRRSTCRVGWSRPLALCRVLVPGDTAANVAGIWPSHAPLTLPVTGQIFTFRAEFVQNTINGAFTASVVTYIVAVLLACGFISSAADLTSLKAGDVLVATNFDISIAAISTCSALLCTGWRNCNYCLHRHPSLVNRLRPKFAGELLIRRHCPWGTFFTSTQFLQEPAGAQVPSAITVALLGAVI